MSKIEIQTCDELGQWSWMGTGAAKRADALCETIEEAERAIESLVEVGYDRDSLRAVEVAS